MDIEFLVQDTFAQLRPQWKLATTLDEASQKFAEACKQNYQNLASAKEQEAEELEDQPSSEDGREDGEDDGPAVNGHSASESEAEVRNLSSTLCTRTDVSKDNTQQDGRDEESDEEHIVVTRPEEQRDPEADADFDRELAKLMSESVDSRKFDRKQVFDVPLPMRRNVQNNVTPVQEAEEAPAPAPSPQPNGNTMKFALLSRRGNKQQTRAIDLPADSNFAVAMRTQQEIERQEQQRIKSLVLNYDLSSTADDQHDGTADSFTYPLQPNMNHKSRPYTRRQTVDQGNTGHRTQADFNPADLPNALSLADYIVQKENTSSRSQQGGESKNERKGRKRGDIQQRANSSIGTGPRSYAAMLRERDNRALVASPLLPAQTNGKKPTARTNASTAGSKRQENRYPAKAS